MKPRLPLSLRGAKVFSGADKSLARFNKFRMALTCLLTTFFLVTMLTARAASRPNFVFIYTDDQRWDILGVVQKEMGDKARFPWFKTPNMDRIANEGVRFRNAFVVNSLCAPSRATFLTGQYGFANGVVNNHTFFPTNNITHASLLRAAGYRTAYVGKWHMFNQVERPGFDFSASFIGQGKYFDCPIFVNGQSTPSQGWVDDVTTDYALNFIRENQANPFLVVLGYKACHGPFAPPPRREKDFEGELARPVPNLQSSAIYRKGGQASTPETLAATKVNLGYFRCIAAADDNVGRVLNLLDELKLTENTVVVFAGDNGYYLGEHQLGDKRTAYEESLRIPLLLRYPKSGVHGKLVDDMVLNIDLAPTFLELAGLAAPPQMHGRSWRPLLDGKAADWRKAFFYCYFFERGFGSPMTTAVRTETAKLIKYPGHDDWTELFDLKADPYELKNLFHDTAASALRAQMEVEYEKQKSAIQFHVPEYAHQPSAADATDTPKRAKGGKKKKNG